MIRIKILQNFGKQFKTALSIHTGCVNKTFWEPHKKAGYVQKHVFPGKKEMIVNGLKELKSEIALWKEEVTEKLRMDPIVVYRPGEVDIIYNFEDKNDIDKWVLTADSDHNEGKSIATMELTNAQSALFQGFVNSQFLKDGKIKRTGYANIRTLRVKV